MKYIFWQNILSIHQSALIRNLAEVSEVILVVSEGLDQERVTHGWNIPDFGNASIVINPDDQRISEYLKDDNSINIFTGINSFPLVYRAFKRAVKNNLRVLVYLEPFNWVDSKAWLRLLKYKLLFLRYKKKIDGILAISSAAKKCYSKAGFNSKKIFDWAYFTENSQVKERVTSKKSGLKLLYVGSIDKRKNIIGVLPIIQNHKSSFLEFNIIGKGSLEKDLDQFTDNEKILYKGAVPNAEIYKYFLNSDILVLPSIFDGWGAVVNEAIMSGTKVLCSESCGASDLIAANRGRIFSHDNNDFEHQLVEIIQEGCVSDNLRLEIADWAMNNISGKAASEYFLKIIKHIYGNEPKPIAPWI